MTLSRRGSALMAVCAALLLVMVSPALAQSVIFSSTTGSITTSGTDCTTATNCVIFPQASRTSNGTIVISGTWVATLQFEGTVADMTVAGNLTGAAPVGWFSLNVQAQGGTAFVTSATANGQWSIPYALTGVRVRASAYTSGTANVAILVTSARPGGGGGGGLTGLATSGTQGDTIYADTATTWARLTGAAGVLHGAVAGNPSWSLLVNADIAAATIDLTTKVTGALPAANGGTGQSSYTIGDLLYASAATTISKLADVGAGSYLRSGGVATAPLWSTLTLPNTATAGDIMVATGTNALGSLADVATGQVLTSGGVGVVPAFSATPQVTSITVGTGSAAATAISRTTTTNTGLFFKTDNSLWQSQAGTVVWGAANSGVRGTGSVFGLSNPVAVAFSPGDISAVAADVGILRDGIGIVRISGIAVNDFTAQATLRVTGTAATTYASLTHNGTNAVFDTSVGAIVLGTGTPDIQWGKALVALGGGVAPTFGTIGGAGPATAAQNTWMRVLDSTGAAFWVPAWK